MNLSTVPRVYRTPRLRQAFSLSPFVRGMGQDPLSDMGSQLDPTGPIDSSNLSDPTLSNLDLSGSGTTYVTPGSSDQPFTPPSTSTTETTATQSTTPSWLASLGTTFSGLLTGAVRAGTPTLIGAITGQPTTPGAAVTGGGTRLTGPAAQAGAAPAGKMSGTTWLLIGGGVIVALMMFGKKR